MNNILISICIPTYNRVNFIEKLLHSIELNNFIIAYEVRIQDNCSTDNTNQQCMELCAKHDNWHYEKNEVNIGGVRNIKKCTENAKGKYLIVIGDDDLLYNNSFEIIHNSIAVIEKENDTVAIFFSNRLGEEYKNCKKFEGGFAWLKKAPLNQPAFISAVIWETKYWQEFDFYGCMAKYYQPHLHCFIYACKEQKVYGHYSELVDEGYSNPTNITSYWFYKFHALVDCFEYPYLYKIIQNANIDIVTRIYIYLRKLKFSKEIIKKIAFIENNKSEYENEIKRLITEFSYAPLTLFFKVYIKIIFQSSLGPRIARKLCPKL